MKHKFVLATAVAVILLAAAAAAGLNAVFSVTAVRVEVTAFSSAAKQDALALQEDVNAFVGASTVFLDTEEVRAAAERYPYFCVEAVEKQYPQTVVLTVREREERFAVPAEGGYRIYDAEGFLLGTRTENASRIDGAPDILLNGLTAEDEQFSYALDVAAAIDGAIGDVRMNLASIALNAPTSDRADDYFLLRMSEGVEVCLYEPSDAAAEKAALAMEKYASLFDEDRMFGRIVVLRDASSGELTATYTPRDLGTNA